VKNSPDSFDCSAVKRPGSEECGQHRRAPGRDTAEPGVLGYRRETAAAIRGFRPAEWSAAWVATAQVVRRIVAAVDPQDPQRARQLMRLVARLAAFVYNAGRPVGFSTLLGTELIDWFCESGCGGLRRSTREQFRRELERLARIVYGGGQAGLWASNRWRPYTAVELTALWWCAAGQRTEQLKRGYRMLLCLGYGCGLPARRIVDLRVCDVRSAAEDGAVRLDLPGGRAPAVCLQGWEGVLGAEITGMRPQEHLLWPGRAKRTSALVCELVRRCEHTDAPPLLVSRLQATWFTDLLLARTPFTSIAAQCGSGELALKTLARVLPYLPEADPGQAALLLRGSAPRPSASPPPGMRRLQGRTGTP
jgi:hypothetical protein